MEVEDVSGVGLSSGRSSQQQGHLSVGDGLLGKIVVDDECVLSVVSEELSNSAAGVGGQELEGSSLRCSGSHDDGVLKGVMSLEGLDDIGDSGSLLSDGNVNAEELSLHVSRVEVSLLVDDGIDGNGSLSGLSVTDDQLSLATTNGDESVHSLEAGLHRLVHGFSGDDAGSLDLHSLSLAGFDWAETIDGISEGIEDSAQHLLSDRDIDDGTGSGDSITFLNLSE